VDINVAHELFGHPCEDHLRATAHKNNIQLKGELLPCHGCIISKSKKKNIKKWNDKRASYTGERLFVDISGPYHPTLKGNRFWLKIVDDFSRYSVSKFIRYKNQLCDELIKHVLILNGNGMKVKFVRMDNAGENIHETKRELKNWALNVN